MILRVMITILISRTKLRTIGLGLASLLLLAACGSGGTGTDGVTVVATTSIWGDVARQIVGDDGTVEVLIPLGADAHDYQASPRDVEAVLDADLVIGNGLGLEAHLEDILESAIGDGANVYEVAPDLDPLPFPEHDEGHDEADADDDHGDLDPHVWFDPARVATAAGLIAERLAEVDPSIDWASRAAAYASDLEAVDGEIEDLVASVAIEMRKLVTNHEALGYFAARYGFDVIGVVIPGGSTLADPSSAELAALVAEIEHEGVTAIFAESTQPSRLADAVAAEVGHDIEVVEIFTESLGESGSDAGSLTGMLITNATRIVAALG
jgi:zinc/manganese transport system substrate-binding protein